jgi:hypothetical protein
VTLAEVQAVRSGYGQESENYLINWKNPSLNWQNVTLPEIQASQGTRLMGLDQESG